MPYLYSLTNKANVASNNSNPTPLTPGSGSGNWIFDVKSGVVFFPDNTTPSLGVVDNSTKKPVFSFYKYIGNKGLSTWSGGGGGGGGGGSTTLGGLTDVSTAGATSGQAIVYNGSSWAPGNVASGGGGGGQVTTSESQFANCILLKPKSNWSYTNRWLAQHFPESRNWKFNGKCSYYYFKTPTNIKTYVDTLTGVVHGSHDFAQGLSTNDNITFNKSGLYRITMYTGPSTCHGISGGVAKLFTQMGYIFIKITTK